MFGSTAQPSTSLCTTSSTSHATLLTWEDELRASSTHDGTVFLERLQQLAQTEFRAQLLQQLLWGAYVSCQHRTPQYDRYAQVGKVAGLLIEALCPAKPDDESKKHLIKVSAAWLKIRVLFEDVDDAVWWAQQCTFSTLPLNKAKVEMLAQTRETWLALRGVERHQHWASILLASKTARELKRTALGQDRLATGD